jgi:hypothetical protein
MLLGCRAIASITALTASSNFSMPNGSAPLCVVLAQVQADRANAQRSLFEALGGC